MVKAVRAPRTSCLLQRPNSGHQGSVTLSLPCAFPLTFDVFTDSLAWSFYYSFYIRVAFQHRSGVVLFSSTRLAGACGYNSRSWLAWITFNTKRMFQTEANFLWKDDEPEASLSAHI